MLGLFGSFKAFTLEDNVLSIFSYDPFCQVYYNFGINSLSASLADLIKEWQSSMIPSISTWPGKLENMWPIAYQVSETSYLRNPEKQWVFISRDTSTLAGPYPLSRRCYPTISSSAVPFSSHPQCFPASGSFQMSHLFTPGGQSIGVSAST